MWDPSECGDNGSCGREFDLSAPEALRRRTVLVEDVEADALLLARSCLEVEAWAGDAEARSAAR